MFRMKRDYITLFLPMICIGVGGYGCSWQRDLDAKAVWVSLTADPQEKVKAATVLIPKHASPKEVKEILGPSVISGGHHGYANRPGSGDESWYFDVYDLGYPVTNGYITIEFENVVPAGGLSDYRFKYALYTVTNLVGNSPFVYVPVQSNNTNEAPK
jgi:hypothetical protein